MIIRKATKKDLKEISNIFRKETSKKPYFQKWTQKTAFEKINESYKENDIYLALVDKKVAGFIISSIHLNNPKKAYIDELWLKSGYQRKGLGKSLVRFIEDKYKSRWVEIMQVVSKRKAGAFKFYNKLGYNQSKELVFMDKKLR